LFRDKRGKETKKSSTASEYLPEGDPSAFQSESESLDAICDESDVEDDEKNHLKGFADAWKEKAWIGVVSVSRAAERLLPTSY
jgi:hypothetical protein